VKPFPGDYLNYTKRLPLGVVAQITPWNHPLLITIKKLAPALAAGNSVVVKPSELAPQSIIELAKLFGEEREGHPALLPPGVFNVVLGDGSTGAQLIKHPLIRKVDFTGGTSTGRLIGRVVGQNLCGYVAELGGKSPMIVFEDVRANIDHVINGCTFGCFIASGQTCIAGTRILIHESILDVFVEKLVSKVSSLKLGDPSATTTHLGPVITAEQLDFIEATVQKSIQDGAVLMTGGKKKVFEESETGILDLNCGHFYEPTVLVCRDHANVLFQTELFGPVVGVCPFKDEEEAVRLANSSEYGLGCSIWTNDLVLAHQTAGKVNAGIIWVNDHHKNDPSSPWGGMTPGSGLGRENGVDAFHEYTHVKSVVVNCGRYQDDWFGSDEKKARYN